MQNTSCKMPDWMKHKLESRLQGVSNINNLGYADDTTLTAEEPLDESERVEKVA